MSCCGTLRIGGAVMLAAACVSAPDVFAQNTAVAPQVSIARHGNTVEVRGSDVLRLAVCSDSVLHVVASPDGSPTQASVHQPWLADADHACPGADFQFTQDADGATVRTRKWKCASARSLAT